MRFRIRKGLDLPLPGVPEAAIADGAPVGSVALLAQDYPGLRPSMHVRDGERVALGQALFHDRGNPDVPFTSPGTGVVSIDRGARRSLRALTIALDGDAEVAFTAFSRPELPRLGGPRVRDLLLASGLWTALRARPYGSVARPGDSPRALFVTATDTNPLAPEPHVVIDTQREAFTDGLTALTQLTDAPVFLCKSAGVDIPTITSENLTVAEFAGPHPAGLVGTHIHLLAPASARQIVWHIGYQDVIAIGKLLTTGRLFVDRVIALAGPSAKRPRHLRTRLGACIDDLVEHELHDSACQVISGSVLSGRVAFASGGFVGRFHNQVTVIPKPQPEAARGVARLRHAWSFHTSRWPSHRRNTMTAALHGRVQPMLPVDTFERVLPLDILPTPLFRALLVGDTERAEALGCLELEEEDLALCTFLCPGKNDYGALLRSALTEIAEQA